MNNNRFTIVLPKKDQDSGKEDNKMLYLEKVAKQFDDFIGKDLLENFTSVKKNNKNNNFIASIIGEDRYNNIKELSPNGVKISFFKTSFRGKPLKPFTFHIPNFLIDFFAMIFISKEKTVKSKVKQTTVENLGDETPVADNRRNQGNHSIFMSIFKWFVKKAFNVKTAIWYAVSLCIFSFGTASLYASIVADTSIEGPISIMCLGLLLGLLIKITKYLKNQQKDNSIKRYSKMLLEFDEVRSLKYIVIRKADKMFNEECHKGYDQQTITVLEKSFKPLVLQEQENNIQELFAACNLKVFGNTIGEIKAKQEISANAQQKILEETGFILPNNILNKRKRPELPIKIAVFILTTAFAVGLSNQYLPYTEFLETYGIYEWYAVLFAICIFLILRNPLKYKIAYLQQRIRIAYHYNNFINDKEYKYNPSDVFTKKEIQRLIEMEADNAIKRHAVILVDEKTNKVFANVKGLEINNAKIGCRINVSGDIIQKLNSKQRELLTISKGLLLTVEEYNACLSALQKPEIKTLDINFRAKFAEENNETLTIKNDEVDSPKQQKNHSLTADELNIMAHADKKKFKKNVNKCNLKDLQQLTSTQNDDTNRFKENLKAHLPITLNILNGEKITRAEYKELNDTNKAFYIEKIKVSEWTLRDLDELLKDDVKHILENLTEEQKADIEKQQGTLKHFEKYYIPSGGNESVKTLIERNEYKKLTPEIQYQYRKELQIQKYRVEQLHKLLKGDVKYILEHLTEEQKEDIKQKGKELKHFEKYLKILTGDIIKRNEYKNLDKGIKVLYRKKLQIQKYSVEQLHKLLKGDVKYILENLTEKQKEDIQQKGGKLKHFNPEQKPPKQLNSPQDYVILGDVICAEKVLTEYNKNPTIDFKEQYDQSIGEAMIKLCEQRGTIEKKDFLDKFRQKPSPITQFNKTRISRDLYEAKKSKLEHLSKESLVGHNTSKNRLG